MFVPNNRDINQRCVVLMMMVRRHPQSLILLPARQVLTHNISDTEPYLHMACGDSQQREQGRYLVCICENCKMLSDHINTLEVKLPKQFMTVIKPKVIKFSTQYPDNVTQEGSIWEVSWSSLGRPGASWELAANITQTLLKFKILKLTNTRRLRPPRSLKVSG